MLNAPFRTWSVARLVLLVLLVAGSVSAQSWPPALPGAVDGVVTLTGPEFLQTPALTATEAAKPGAAKFVVAKTPPVVDLVYHAPLPGPAVNGTGWSAWGDICVASSGDVYVATGDHGPDKAGTSAVFIYHYDPKIRKLTRIANPNDIGKLGNGFSAWSKVHARIDEGPDGKIYYCCTFNNGHDAPQMNWPEHINSSSIIQYDPQTGENTIVGQLPKHCATATSLIDREHGIWYCNLERGGGKDALFAFDLKTMEPIYEGPAGMITKNRNFALARDGSIYFNGAGQSIGRYDPATGEQALTKSELPGGGMRATTRETSDGWIYGAVMGPGQLFRFNTSTHEVQMLGPDFLAGSYTTVTVLSPDEKYVYYLPGAHGGSWKIGCPIVQYNIATGQQKVIAFLRPLFEQQVGYVPNGTYGAKISADGATLYVNLNGHAVEKLRVSGMTEGGFGLTGLAAIHIPESER